MSVWVLGGWVPGVWVGSGSSQGSGGVVVESSFFDRHREPSADQLRSLRFYLFMRANLAVFRAFKDYLEQKIGEY